MRGSNTCELVFEDCMIPADQVLGEVGSGVRVLMSGLDYERAVLSGGPWGYCRPVLMRYCPTFMSESNLVNRLAIQLVQGKLADMYACCSASRAYLYGVCEALIEASRAAKMPPP